MSKIKKNAVYNVRLSGYQIDVIESSIENALGDGFFSGQDQTVAEHIAIKEAYAEYRKEQEEEGGKDGG